MALIWKRMDAYYWQAGEYCVCVAGPEWGRVFSAWGPKVPPAVVDPRRPGYGATPNPLGTARNFQDAAALCEAHATQAQEDAHGKAELPADRRPV